MQAREEFYSQLNQLKQRFDAMEPEMEVTVRDGDLNVEGHIVVWNTGISRNGPLPFCAKGGTRIRPGLTRAEIQMLARNMAIKNAAAGLPLGGCKSGMNADSRSQGFEQRYRRFVELCKPFTYENGGVFGGFGFDIGAAPEHAVWACDTLNSTKSFTGKPVDMGGTDYDREGIAGLGVAESASRLLALHGEDIRKIRFAVHGVGAMGAAVIRYFSEHGARLHYLGDPKFGGTWYFKEGITQPLLDSLVNHHYHDAQQAINKFGKRISEDANAVLFSKVDVLFPCAIQNVIHKNNAHQLQARYIVEGANNPTQLAAYDTIYQQGIHHIPDFIANAGGVIAAFVELTSSVTDEENARTRAKVIEAKNTTREKISQNIDRIYELACTHKTSLRDAALYIALNAVLEHEVQS